jgi:hypothetical protein
MSDPPYKRDSVLMSERFLWQGCDIHQHDVPMVTGHPAVLQGLFSSHPGSYPRRGNRPLRLHSNTNTGMTAVLWRAVAER